MTAEPRVTHIRDIVKGGGKVALVGGSIVARMNLSRRRAIIILVINIARFVTVCYHFPNL